MSDPAYQLDPNHPANKGIVNKYPAQSERNDRARDEALSKARTGYRGHTPGPQEEATADVQTEPARTETDRLFPDPERVAEARQAQKLLGYLPSRLPAGNFKPRRWLLSGRDGRRVVRYYLGGAMATESILVGLLAILAGRLARPEAERD